MANSAFGQFLVNAAQNGANSIGKINVLGGPVNLQKDTELSFSVDPKIDLSKLDLGHLDINQISITDTKIEIDVKHNLADNLSVNFSVNSSVKDFLTTPTENGTRISIDLTGTQLSDAVDLKFGVSNTLAGLTSPSGTNDFKFSLATNIKY